ncbi:zinc-binding oxidoreductase alcohol dehydrogenase [Tothia fuscella]|uniref:Zinc-binding oxidoreductase alcohol dehydrogenase n=1 Tax=Tothia fuscella TaxID=1048955 RepID=A0A9P4U0M9_9PEZI|nr:zinc-binding oxidoreductase alcohol dehydrogenase [Tothia fuscella]
MKAIVANPSKKGASLVTDRDVPKMRPDQILVKTVAVALNPTDWKGVAAGMAAEDGLVGCDYAGVVEDVGSEVTKQFKKGNRICGCSHGSNASNKNDGAFAEYILVKGDLQMHIPDSLTFEQASTISLGASTVGQGLYQTSIGINLPTEPASGNEWILIYGGSSATGSLAVQYAKLSGYKVISTASPKHHDWVKSLGATEVFDYKKEGVGAEIRKYTDNKLKYSWDTISISQSAQICADALSSDSGVCKYGTILPIKSPREDVKSAGTMMYTIFGEKFQKGGRVWEASQEDFEFAKKFYGITESLLRDGRLKTHPEKVGEGGLEGVLKGLQWMKEGNVSGEKLVYRVADTPDKGTEITLGESEEANRLKKL